MPIVAFKLNSYQISVMTYTEGSTEPKGLSAELWDVGGTAPVEVMALETPDNYEWQMAADELFPTASSHIVKIRVTGTEYHGSIAALTMVRQGSPNRFDTHSERMNWRNDTTGGRAWILPYGHSVPTSEVDWAGLVNDQTSEHIDWSLRSRQLAIDSDRVYRVCFKVRGFPAGAGSGFGQVLLGDGASASGPGNDPIEVNAVYIDEPFAITDTWTTVCTQADFQAQAGDNLLKFAHLEGEPEYLVDDVLVLEL